MNRVHPPAKILSAILVAVTTLGGATTVRAEEPAAPLDLVSHLEPGDLRIQGRPVPSAAREVGIGPHVERGSPADPGYGVQGSLGLAELGVGAVPFEYMLGLDGLDLILATPSLAELDLEALGLEGGGLEGGPLEGGVPLVGELPLLGDGELPDLGDLDLPDLPGL